MTTGTLEFATIAAGLRGRMHTPEGWKVLGQGSFRVAYLAPDGIVYKVGQEHRGRHNSQQASNEAHNYDAMVERLLARNITGWEIVPAQEYVVSGTVVVAQPVSPGVLGTNREPAYCDGPDYTDIPLPEGIDPYTEPDAYNEAWQAYYTKQRDARKKHEQACETCIAYLGWIAKMDELQRATGYWDVHSANYTVADDGTMFLFDYGGTLSTPHED